MKEIVNTRMTVAISLLICIHLKNQDNKYVHNCRVVCLMSILKGYHYREIHFGETSFTRFETFF